MNKGEKIAVLLEKDTISLLCELGKEKGVRHNEENYRTSPIRIKRPHPYEYYAAHRWLQPNIKKLQKHICEEWGYLSKRENFPRGKEIDLILNLSEVIKELLAEDIDPILVSTILFKQGLDSFCSRYKNVDKYVQKAEEELSRRGYEGNSALEILDKALAINPDSPDANHWYGNILLNQGKWKEAIKYLEKTIEHNPTHSLALNDLGYILSAYEVDQDKGFEYAKQALSMTLKGSYEEPYVLDTVGWAYYEREHDLVEAEKYLREALKSHPLGQEGYVLCLYHLIVVLDEAGKTQEMKELYSKLLAINPESPLDMEAYKKAESLMLDS